MSEGYPNALVGDDNWMEDLDAPASGSDPTALAGATAARSKRDMALAYGAKALMDRISVGEGTAGDAGYDTVYNHLERRPGVGLPTQKTIDEWQSSYGVTLRKNGGKEVIGKVQFAPITMPRSAGT
jgi:hypothetical protein